MLPDDLIANWTQAFAAFGSALGDGLVALTLGVLGALIAFQVVFFALQRAAKSTQSGADDLIVARLRAPALWCFIAIGVTLAAQASASLYSIWQPVAQFARPALFGWLGFALVRGVTAAFEAQLIAQSEAEGDSADIRSQRTRLAIMSRVVTAAVVVLTIGLMLSAIPSVRLIGTTMLASAGLAALAVGAAAQPVLRSLISGLQVVMTEPIRIGDLVKVDEAVGRVEQIQLSYVSVRTWDGRELIIPTHRFLDATFENWTRQNETLSGSVFLNLDPIADVDAIRAEALRYIQDHPLYDRRDCAVYMVEAHPESIELRLSMSANTVADLWELRCATREHMLKWMRENMIEALIRHRLEVENANARG